MIFEFTGIQKMSFNEYNNLHWSKKKHFKDNLKWIVKSVTNKRLKSGYDLSFEFEFIGRKLDTINVFHYAKIIEDVIFPQDSGNNRICILVKKGKENKITLTLNKSLTK